VHARRSRFRIEEKSKMELRQGAMYRSKVKKVVDKLKKMGKFDEDNFKQAKKKMAK